MPRISEAVYRDRTRGTWYFKATIGRDPVTGRYLQATKRGFETAADAVKARREFLGKLDAGEVRPSRSSVTVGDILDEYLDGLDLDGRLSARTRFDHRRRTEVHIRPRFGKARLRDLTPEACLAWQRGLLQGTARSGGLAPNTVRLIRQPFKGALDLAVKRGLLTRSPLDAVPGAHVPRSTPRHWTPEQARDFLAFMEGDRTWPIWAFMLGTGLRIGEVVWLRWSRIDIDRRELAVVEFASRVGSRVVAAPGKSANAVRTVALDTHLVEVLDVQRELQAADRAAHADRYSDSDFVFTKSNGGSYDPNHLSKQVVRHSRAAGLPPLSAHGLRHTAATLMLATGVPPKVAAERLGHANPVLFSNLYAHVTPSMQHDAAAAIGRALFGEVGRRPSQ